MKPLRALAFCLVSAAAATLVVTIAALLVLPFAAVVRLVLSLAGLDLALDTAWAGTAAALYASAAVLLDGRDGDAPAEVATPRVDVPIPNSLPSN